MGVAGVLGVVMVFVALLGAVWAVGGWLRFVRLGRMRRSAKKDPNSDCCWDSPISEVPISLNEALQPGRYVRLDWRTCRVLPSQDRCLTWPPYSF